MRRGRLIWNPVAGRADGASSHRAEQVAAVLRGGGYEVEITPTTQAGDGARLAREAAAAGFDAVFALGGDGTLREAAEGLLGSGVPLGTLPGGTTNVLPRALGLPADPLRAAARVTQLPPRPLAAGRAGERLFLMMASAGLDAATLESLNLTHKRHFGRLYIAAHGLVTWARYRHSPFTLHLPEGSSLAATFAVVANIPLYGGAMVMAPRARSSQPGFEIITFQGGRWAVLGFALAVARGHHLRRDDVTIRSVTGEVRIEGPPELRLQVDGDALVGGPPFSIRPEPRELLVLAPPDQPASC